MKVKVHNVGHGSCISLHHENGNSIVWDCGHKEDNRPSDFLRAEGLTKVDRLFITNYDEDHISDLLLLRHKLPIQLIHYNNSISPQELRSLKRRSGPISTAMTTLLYMLENTSDTITVPLPHFPSVEYNVFCNSFDDFEDTNNCSLVTFLSCNGLKFIIPGDVERIGWLKLLEDQNFRQELLGVNVFVASHHGRESGYCSEVFDFCSPEVVIFSDSNIQYATQEMSAIYRNHCSGTQFNGTNRYVLSTRNDGSIWWDL